MEKEQNNKLPFLNVLVAWTEQGFRSSVYHKPTFTKQYLNFNSHHPHNVKIGIIHCLQRWAKAISSNTNAYQEEMISLRHNFHCNNNTECITSAPRNLDRRIEGDIRKLTTVCLPYDIRTIFTSSSTLQMYFFSVKPPTEFNMTKNCVYSICCSCGKVYKIKTCHPLTVRLEEYRKAGVCPEIEKGNYLALWDEVKIIDREEHWRIKCLKESAQTLGYSDLFSRSSIENQ